jgi:RHS repeat-associated protein
MTILKNIVFTLLLIATTSFAYCQQPVAWSHPIFKAIEKKAANIVTFSHKDSNDYYVPLAVLNKTAAKLYYINTFGFVFDSLSIAPMLLKELAAKKKDAFTLYTSLVTTVGLTEIQQMKEKVKDKKLDKAKIIGKQTFIDYTSLLNAVSTFEQLTMLDNIEKEVWQNHYLINLVLADKKDTAFLTKQNNFANFKPCKIFLHQQKEHNEVGYVEFTSCNRFSRLNKAVLMPATANIYLYNRLDELVDSFKVKKENLKDITADKQDVFALYRMWLEWQAENTDKQLKKLLPAKNTKFDAASLTEGQLQYLDTLLRYASYTQQKINYTTRPDKDLLLANMLELGKTAPRKNWTATTQQWQDVPMPPIPPPTPTTIAMPGGYTGTLSTFTRGEKEYFLTDHRGNVMATVTDRKIQVDNNNDGIVDYYVTDVVTATDYAPFGAQLPGRTYRGNGKDLRYGYNGKENDNEVKGEGNQIDYGMRIYDPRLGRFLSVDPLINKYPDLNPYHFSANNPILFIDYDGKDFGIKIDHNTKTIIIVANVYTTSKTTYEQAKKAAAQWNSKSAIVDGYTVTFQVNAKEFVNGDLTDEQLKDKNIRNSVAWAAAVFDKIGNEFLGGATENGKHISMSNHDEKGDMGNYEDLVTHEFGHLFGLDDEDGNADGKTDPYYSGKKGIMEYKGTDLSPISDKDVKTILSFVKDALAGKTKEGDAKVEVIEQKGKSDGKNPIGIKNE